MRKSEVLTRFDDIVEFAGLAKFLETPVKRYSSGMYMRLAFSVAAHLEPEILLVDEVLAVGDAEFQRKCLGKMENLSGTGRTVLFVSHSMPSVLRLCPRVILLDGGQLTADGDASHVVDEYMGHGGGAAERTWADHENSPGNDVARFRTVRVVGEDGKPASRVDIQQDVGIQVEYRFLGDKHTPRVNVFLDICNEQGIELFVTQDANNAEWRDQTRKPGLVRSTCWLPGNLLAEGTHTVHATLGSSSPRETYAHERDAVAFQVVDDTHGEGVRADWPGEWPGVIRPMLEWTIETDFEVSPD
jgi:lipopolysaccharide transport system ATP-binding protein